jgi:hypothetical protein
MLKNQHRNRFITCSIIVRAGHVSLEPGVMRMAA